MLLTGCQTARSWPAIDAAQPGWRVREGQAVWTPKARSQAIAGEILLGTGPAGECLVQFSKTPFPLVTARRDTDAWQIEFGAGARRIGGLGSAPARWVWFQLPSAGRGEPLSSPWQCEPAADGGSRLANSRTGEKLEVWWTP